MLGLPTAFFHELVYAVRHAGLRFPDSLRTIIIGGEAALAAITAEEPDALLLDLALPGKRAPIGPQHGR